MAAVPWTKVLVVSYPRTGQQDLNQGAETKMKFFLEAQVLVPMPTAQARPNDARPAMRDWQWWGLKTPSSHDASSALTARAARDSSR
jgi:hypothetical protein